MFEYIDKRIKEITKEALQELEICGLEWNDNFYDLYNYSPDFDFGEEEHAKFFQSCMARIEELENVIKNFK